MITETLTVRLPAEEAQRLRALAEANGVTLSVYLREALRVVLGRPQEAR